VYGVPKDLDLSRFHGSSLVQIAIGEFQVQFHFEDDASIGVEGRWELFDAAGSLLDQAMENSERDWYRVHGLLGHQVVGSEVEPPTSFTLVFDDGQRLKVYDDSGPYESFSIQPGDVFI